LRVGGLATAKRKKERK